MINDKIYMTCGRTTSLHYFNDLHVFDCAKKSWTELTPTGDIPSPRAATSIVAIGTKIYMYVLLNLVQGPIQHSRTLVRFGGRFLHISLDEENSIHHHYNDLFILDTGKPKNTSQFSLLSHFFQILSYGKSVR